jgi:hypothetical protein
MHHYLTVDELIAELRKAKKKAHAMGVSKPLRVRVITHTHTHTFPVSVDVSDGGLLPLGDILVYGEARTERT